MQTVQPWWRRLLDGAHVWGSFDAMVGHHGVRRYRLIVFPPGISTIDRRLLRLWRGWPVGGGMLALVTVMFVSNTLASPETTVEAAAAVYVGLGVWLFVVTTTVRRGVRSMSLVLFAGAVAPSERLGFAELQRLVDILNRADSLADAGVIAPAEHEALWWQAYNRLEVPAGV